MVGIVHIGIAMIVFHQEAKHVFIGNGILDEILMQAVAEYLLCGMSVNGILCKDRCASETEYLCVVEELHDVLVAIAKVTAMTFVENHHDTRMAYLPNAAAVPLSADCGIEFLYGGDDNLGVAVKTFDQLVSIVGAVNCPWLKGLIFGLRLCVEVVAVDNEHHLVYIVQL